MNFKNSRENLDHIAVEHGKESIFLSHVKIYSGDVAYMDNIFIMKCLHSRYSAMQEPIDGDM